MIFPYKEYGSKLRPVIPIRLRNSSTIVPYEVIVDSGSDFCIFNADIAELLGIQLLDGEKRSVQGLGGKISHYYVHVVEIIVNEISTFIKAGFMANVSGDDTTYGIVGQKGFFDSFVIKFNLSKREIELI